MRYNIGLTYVGNEAYVNEKFTLHPGQSIIVPDELGTRLLGDFPGWFETFDGVDEILTLGTVGLMDPYNHLNQNEAFEDPDGDTDEAPATWEDDDADGTDADPEAEPKAEDENEPEAEAEPMTDEEKALDAAVTELVDEKITEAVIEKLGKKAKA
jgi:hypothetical protein